MTDELQRSLTNRIEHLIATEVQRDGIDLQLVGHDDPRSTAMRGEA